MNTQAIKKEKAHHLLHQMLRIRRFEEKCAELYAKEKIRGFLHLYIGEEAIAVGIVDDLLKDDYILGTYREHGHALARGLSARSIMAEMYGKQEGCSRGRGGSMHLFDAEWNFYGGNAIVGGHLPMAIGVGLSLKMQQRPGISVCFFGEGAVAEGEFHECMNLASLWQLPVLFVCENNLYAMGTALDISESETDISRKASSYQIKAEVVNGMDVLEVNETGKRAIDYVRRQGKPYFLECRTYRFRAHSMYDAELYRQKEEVEKWKERGPIKNLVKALRQQHLINDAEIEVLEQKVAAEVQDAVDFAENGTWEPVSDLTRFVYSENQ